MATPEPVAPSRRLQSAAAAERERLSRELSRLDHRADELQRELDALDGKRAALRDQLSLLARVAPGDSPFPERISAGRGSHLQAVGKHTPSRKAVLRGSRIREMAVVLLASSPNPRRPIHYQQWFDLLSQAGYEVEAQDPPAAFLTQISRSPVVRRAGAPGVYALDFDAPHALRERLTKLEHELAQVGVPGGKAEEVAAARERRTALLNKTRAAERQLEEALRSLGDHR